MIFLTYHQKKSVNFQPPNFGTLQTPKKKLNIPQNILGGLGGRVDEGYFNLKARLH